MFRKPARKPLGMPAFLVTVVLTLSASSCGHTEASLPPASPDVVMQSIRDYGRSHQALLIPGTSQKPDQSDFAYSAHIRSILVEEDFAQLEKIAQQNRVEKGRLLGGVWKVFAFYQGTGAPASYGTPTEADWQRHISTLKKWIAAYPKSTAARLSLAYLNVNYSWVARGSGFADSVSDAQWKLFRQRNAEAKSLLLEAGSFNDKDPFWFQVMQLVCHNEGWDKAQARELFDQAVAFEPGYYHYYIEYSRYLLPQWYGQPGDIQAFADEISSRVPDPDGSMFYFWILANRACYCQQPMEELRHASYEKLYKGYSSIVSLYGASNLNANRFAFMATTFLDQPAARDAFANITQMDQSIWTYQSIYDDSHEWATSP